MGTRAMGQSTLPIVGKISHRNQKGFVRLAILMSIVGFLVWSAYSLAAIGQAQADVNQPEILSGVSGYCLDSYHGGTKSGTIIDSWLCNGSKAQRWQFSQNRVMFLGKYCLNQVNSTAVLSTCSKSSSDLWVRHGVGLENDANHQCLALPNAKTGHQLVTVSCNNMTSVAKVWTPSEWTGKPIAQMSSPSCSQRQLGARVACFAQRQWLAWQTEPQIHKALLNDYTDSNPYEEWCADFVSYVYWEAGAPFTNGERNGWDQYNANYIRYMGFTYHSASSGYIPKPGDVAYFNYSGGHVEIVVSGGKHPTFIYGDSGVIDPVSGNGNMAENQITSDGHAGHIVYYLSPN